MAGARTGHAHHRTGRPVTEQLVELDGLTRHFGSIKALDGLSLGVPEGTVCGLLGPNGSGKTTAIRLLLGLSRPTAGTAKLLGETPGGPGFAEAIHHTGSLIEGPALYGRATGRQNMQIQARARGLDYADAGIEELLDLVGLHDRAGSRARTYSLGMKQRLGLALALIGQPRLVILDEPTNGLDPSGIVEMRKLIKSLPDRGVTVLVSSHLLSEVQLMCDRVTIINRGRLIADGTMAEVLAASGAGGGYVTTVRPETTAAATAALEASGFAVSSPEPGTITVSGCRDGAEITRTLASADIYLGGLRETGANLEQAFLELTGNESGDAR